MLEFLCFFVILFLNFYPFVNGNFKLLHALFFTFLEFFIVCLAVIVYSVVTGTFGPKLDEMVPFEIIVVREPECSVLLFFLLLRLVL